ncbi:hypothetical protein NLU13_7944 [Sarocladium strictum]|uniref:Uncharacterized protein n=1 Tax=Sarocladium strictum TaxID=5046 RepID=A0AA39GEY2_SARSR|nr:hypothetical protein NLU13_7944 [Sarocladium strictum]
MRLVLSVLVRQYLFRPAVRLRHCPACFESTIASLVYITRSPCTVTIAALVTVSLSAESPFIHAMDKMSKFRRKQKPKPPTIETSVPRVSSETSDSLKSEKGIAVAAAAAAAPVSGTTTSSSSTPSSPTGNSKRSGAKSSRKSPFRSLGLRSYRKRARGSPPAELSSSPPPPAVVGQDGAASLKSQRMSTDHDHETQLDGERDVPKIPGFLTLSEQEIDGQYQSLTWNERSRVLAGVRREDGEENRWGQYKQIDRERGIMDRYNNIKPWNHNRVRLQVPENQFDYVNASAIELPSSSDPTVAPLRYIAMQGPTEPSFAYVWRMIAEQLRSPAVIIQLTSMVENGTIKCHQYFPEDDEESDWSLNEDDIWEDGWKARLVSDSVEELAGGAIEKRKLLLHVQNEAEPRLIWHLLYRKWPDFGLPEHDDLESFFEVMRLSRVLSPDPSNPRIIHCSAGVGRTGTFISLEHLMRELDLGALRAPSSTSDEVTEADLVHDTVDFLRQQRRGMVQGELQYRFIYQVLRRLWQDRYGTDEYDSGAEPVAKRLEVGSTGVDPFLDECKSTDGTGDGEKGERSTEDRDSLKLHR